MSALTTCRRLLEILMTSETEFRVHNTIERSYIVYTILSQMTSCLFRRPSKKNLEVCEVNSSLSQSTKGVACETICYDMVGALVCKKEEHRSWKDSNHQLVMNLLCLDSGISCSFPSLTIFSTMKKIFSLVGV